MVPVYYGTGPSHGGPVWGHASMDETSDQSTSVSLLETLRQSPDNALAWERFVVRYRPMLIRWCREWGLQGADAEDVAQDVLARLTAVLGKFRYDQSRCFRAWLKTLAHHAWSDATAARLRFVDRRVVDRLQSNEARADLQRRFEEQYDRELMEMAMERVRARVSGPTWAAFQLLAIDRCSGAEAAEQLGLSVASVFVARHRVQQQIKLEVERLGGLDRD